jgi:hypothetical protein
VGNGDAVAKTGGAEFFTGNQRLEDILHLQIRHFSAIRLAILFEGFLLLPPGTFTRERPGVRMVSSRIMGEGFNDRLRPAAGSGSFPYAF